MVCDLADQAMWKTAIRFYWQMKCAQSVSMYCHPPKPCAQRRLSLAALHSEGFYSLWISVKSLSSLTALCSPPLFSTLGGHFSSDSVKERAELSNKSLCFILACRLIIHFFTGVPHSHTYGHFLYKNCLAETFFKIVF